MQTRHMQRSLLKYFQLDIPVSLMTINTFYGNVARLQTHATSQSNWMGIQKINTLPNYALIGPFPDSSLTQRISPDKK